MTRSKCKPIAVPLPKRYAMKAVRSCTYRHF